MSERQVCMIGGGMSLWGVGQPVWLMSSRKRRKLVSMTFPELREKMSTDFYLLHLIAAEIRFRSMPPR